MIPCTSSPPLLFLRSANEKPNSALHRRKAGVNCPFFIAPDPRPTPTVLAKKIKSTDSLSSKKGKKVAVVVEKVEEVVEKIVQMDLETPVRSLSFLQSLN